MKSIYVFGNQFNGLEFVTYILIPSSIFLVILIYIFFNIQLLKLSFDYDLSFFKKIDDSIIEKQKKLNVILKKYLEDLYKNEEK